MTDVPKPALPETISVAAQAAVQAALQPLKPARFALVDEWHWVLSRSWSLRFIFLAFLLSAAEVALPLLSSAQGLPFYPILIAATAGAAFVARLVAQKREGVVSGE